MNVKVTIETSNGETQVKEGAGALVIMNQGDNTLSSFIGALSTEDMLCAIKNIERQFPGVVVLHMLGQVAVMHAEDHDQSDAGKSEG